MRASCMDATGASSLRLRPSSGVTYGMAPAIPMGRLPWRAGWRASSPDASPPTTRTRPISPPCSTTSQSSSRHCSRRWRKVSLWSILPLATPHRPVGCAQPLRTHRYIRKYCPATASARPPRRVSRMRLPHREPALGSMWPSCVSVAIRAAVDAGCLGPSLALTFPMGGINCVGLVPGRCRHR